MSFTSINTISITTNEYRSTGNYYAPTPYGYSTSDKASTNLYVFNNTNN